MSMYQTDDRAFFIQRLNASYSAYARALHHGNFDAMQEARLVIRFYRIKLNRLNGV